MTRKDYILIAAALKAVPTHPDTHARTHELAALELVWRLQQDNPRFDRERFLRAAGVT
jgi:hypothetical protein